MKKSLVFWLNIQLASTALTSCKAIFPVLPFFLFLGCTQVERDNPFDPDGVNYSGSSLPSSNSVVASSNSHASSSSITQGSSSSVVPSSSSARVSSSSKSEPSSSSEVLCNGTPYNFYTEFCYRGNIYGKCGGSDYSPAIEQCCGSNKYATATQFCYNSSNVGSFCGSRTQIYNPDLYECRAANPNGIYLKGGVSDGSQTYNAVLIGNQTWMAENLNYNARGKCYNNSDLNCTKYGRLYDWATAMAACPTGWHLPTREEWDLLSDAVGGSSIASRYLKATSGWNDSGNGTNAYGFSALPGGFNNYGTFYEAGISGRWWSASGDDGGGTGAYIWSMRYSSDDNGWSYNAKSLGFSVRCLQD